MSEQMREQEKKTIFTKEMKKTHTILVPTMLPIHFRILGDVLKMYGYKVKVLDNSEYDPREAAGLLCEGTGAECVQVIGRKFVLFKRKKKESAFDALLKK